MEHFCQRCGNRVELLAGGIVARSDSCSSCGADLHVCLNCHHFEKSAYNQCREPQADRVLDKDRSNFCDYFRFRNGKSDSAGGHKSVKDAALKKLDDLFKK